MCQKKLKLELVIMKLEDKEHEEPRRKACKRPHKSNNSWNRNPKVTEKTKKRKRKQSVISFDSAHGLENTRNTSSGTNDMQPEPKSIHNPSKQAKIIQFDDTQI